MQFLKNSNLQDIDRVLVIGAHFDDCEVGVGGTLLKHADKGDEIYIAIVDSDEFRTGEPKMRKREQLAAMKFVGIPKKNLITFTSKDHEPEIISALDEVRPDVIYTVYHKDTHQAHRRASSIAQSVGRKRNITTMFFYCGSSIEFYPNMFSIIDKNRKEKLISFHKTQIECGAIKRTIKDRMEAYWGALISVDEDCRAEGLMVRKMIYNL